MTKYLYSALFWSLAACASESTRPDDPAGTAGTSERELTQSEHSNGASGGTDGTTGGTAGSAAGAMSLDLPDSGAGGSAGASALDGGSGGQASTRENCPKPPGADVDARTYDPPTTAQGCRFDEPGLESATLESESAFLVRFGCPEGAASGIDFGGQRLRVTVIPEAGFLPPDRRYAVLQQGTVRLGLELPVYCGGAFPPTAVVMTLLPAGAEPIVDEVCRPGSCGAGGFPP
jgi:hypothetical protein